MKPYPEYKDSNFDWLGSLPAGWKELRLKLGFDLQKRTITSDMEIITAFRDGEVTLRKNRRLDGFTEGDKQIGYQGIEPGDLVIHAMDAFAGAIGVSDSRGKSTPVYSVCKPKPGVQAAFFAFALRHLALTGYIVSLSKGIRERSTDFRWADAKNVIVPFPPQNEQREIVAFLNQEIDEIDAFIADQEELIILLTERRTTTITQTITRGLNPEVAVKDSRIAWLGKIPEHWTVSRFSRCVRINSGQVDPKTSPFSDMYLIAPNHVESSTGRLIGLETASAQGAESGKYLVRAGQIIYSKIRPNLMKTVIAPIDCLCSADMYALESDRNQLGNKFLMYLLLSRPFHDYAVDQSMRVAMPKLNHDSLGAAPVWLPPQWEQEQIVRFFEAELPKIDAAITDAREAITLSKERKAAVISAAVTGKIDVRGLVAQSTNDVKGVSVGVA
ncbi:restriction endonuclease subunit S [Glutamicibacter ardleyensis]|uniref:restriction endonuclease subunit S n=1 Tax=Glutamicibacter ardleyensis TaxID=225894 RepID=UPI003FD3CA39